MKHIAIFASGTGSNAKKIIDHFKLHAEITVSLVVSNKPDAAVLVMAKKEGIDTLVIDRDYLYKKRDILIFFNKYSIDFVVLAGFLWLVPVYLVREYTGRMVNIHPSLLPKYGGKGMFGMHVHEAVKAAGEKRSGITIHYVNEQYDDGDIVFQKTCDVVAADSPETIARKVQALEHKYFPIIIEILVCDR